MGGGLYVSVHDSDDNDGLHPKSLIARDLTFTGNLASHGGGFAMSVSTSEPAHKYEFELSDMKFERNDSRTGSAMFIAGTRDATLEPLFLNVHRIDARDNITSDAAAIQLDAESLVTVISDSQVVSNLAPVAAILENSSIEFDEFDPPSSLDKRRLALGDTFFCENSHKDAHAGSPFGWHDMGGNIFGCGSDPIDSDTPFTWTSEDIVDWAMGTEKWSAEASRDLDKDGRVTAKDLVVLMDSIGVQESFRHKPHRQQLSLKRGRRLDIPKSYVPKSTGTPHKLK
jgi:hypothetical protein